MTHDPSGTSPIDHKTLADQAFDYLSDAILSGQLSTGDRLVETELSKRLGISRAPIREALVELERQGLAYSVVRRGTFVRSWTKQDLWEVALFRAHLEALAAELATPLITSEDMEHLEGLVAQMQEAERRGDVPALLSLDSQFHDRVVSRCNHQRLIRALADLALQVRITRILTRPTDHVDYPVQHRTYLVALRSRDPKVARDTVFAHVMSTARLALAAFRDGEPIALPRT